jgi:hypothetical protein
VTSTGTSRRVSDDVAMPPVHPRRDTLRRVGGALVAYLTAQGVFLVVLRALSPRFFWLDDQQAQYLPAFHWLGRTAVDGRPALLDPDAGGGGNYVADPQYGVLDPTHWLISWAVSRFDVVLDAAWLLGAGAVIVMGTGIVLLLVALRVRPALAAAAAVGASSTGFFLWMGSSWWPLMWGSAWLCWLWLGLVLPRWPGVVVTALAAWQLTASGYPYVLVPAGILVLGHLVERLHRRDVDGRRGPLVSRLIAGTGGLVAGLPGLIGTQELVEASTRAAPPETPVGNTGAYIPNLLDAVLGGSTLTPSISGSAGGYLFVTPVAATVLFAVPVLALVAWRRAVRRPGVLTALVLLGGGLVLTQMPTDVGSLRIPMRYLAVSAPAMAVLAVLAVTVAPCVNRRRLAVALALIGGQFVLALLRGPALVGWHLLAAVLAVVAVAAVARLIGRSDGPPVDDGRPVGAPATRAAAVHAPIRGRTRAWAYRGVAALVVALAVAAPLAAVAATITTGNRLAAQAGAAPRDELARQLLSRTAWGLTVDQFHERSAVRDGSATALVYGDFHDVALDSPDQGWAWGVLQGNANLLADFRPGFGYVAVGHDEWRERWCQNLFGQLSTDPACIDGLLAQVPGLDIDWVDALSSDEVLLSPYTPEDLVQHFRSTREATGLAGAYGRFVREDDLPGRVTWASTGVSVSAARGSGAAPPDSPFYSGQPGESLVVSTPERGGTLVFRIPAWPGFRADLEGGEAAVGSVADTLLSVELPGGLDNARLDLRFELIADRLLVPSALAGGILLIVGLVVEVGLARRRRFRTEPGLERSSS